MNGEGPVVVIRYCTQCNWLLRSGWMAQELLASFAAELGGVTLAPATGGTFDIRIGEALIWERVRDGGFPDIRELKRRVRDVVAPERNLGHTEQH
ncbi:MAG: SelT/SelW/SelH family protein [Rhodobacteraceae bacterium]|nr:SelT/SelW/SelH family protein [Paracoccaceae bacterium]